MRFLVLVLLLALLALAMPLGNAGPLDLSRPTAAFAWTSDGTASLAWIPGAIPADDYYILAGQLGDMQRVGLVPGSQFTWTVEGNYTSYAIQSVRNGVASDPVAAVVVGGPSCVRIEWDPPTVHIGCDPANGSGTGSILLDVPLVQ